MIDAAVIGAGPSGSRTAFQLAARGYRVAVLEKNSAIGFKTCCTGIISQKCIQDFSIPDSVIFQLHRRAVIYSPSGLSIQVSQTNPQAGIVNRPAFDRWLAEKAVSKGAQYRLDCKVNNLAVFPDRVDIEFESAGETKTLKAAVVIIANGFNSLMVKRIGLGQPSYQVTGVQTEVTTPDCRQIEVYLNQKIAPGFFAWLVPTCSGKALAGLMTRQSPGQHLRSWLESLAAEGRIEPAQYSIQYCGIPLKPLPQTVKERVLVVGDAAGLVKPTTGGGIYFGMLCADVAAETIHRAFTSGDFSRRSLYSYQMDWRDLLGAELKREYLARRAYQLLSNRQLDNLFKTLNKNGIVDSLLHDEYTSFDNHGSLLLKALKTGWATSARRVKEYLTGK